MKAITLGQVITFIVYIASFIAALKVIKDSLAKTINNMFNPINNQINDLEISSIKNDLVNIINDIEHDIPKSQIQKMNAHELYDRYSKLGGNSYVHEHWEKLKNQGKI